MLQVDTREQPVPGIEVVAPPGGLHEGIDTAPDFRRRTAVKMLVRTHVVVPEAEQE